MVLFMWLMLGSGLTLAGQCPENNEVFTQSVFFVCQNEGVYDLTGRVQPSFEGGTFSGDFVQPDGTLDPAGAPIGPLFNIFYTLDVPGVPTPCVLTIPVEVFDGSQWTFNYTTPIEPVYCASQPAIVIEGTVSGPPGSVTPFISVDGNNTILNPAAGPVPRTVVIEVVYGSGTCPLMSTETVDIIPNPSFANLPTTITPDDEVVTFSVEPAGLGELSIDGQEQINPIINPADYEIGDQIAVEYSVNDACTETAFIDVVAPPPPPEVEVAFDTVRRPTAFSPNEDGNNDRFRIGGPNVISADVQIFNRWGQRVFDSEGNLGDGWDGRWNGEPQPIGVYVVQAVVTFSDGSERLERGSLTLVR